MLFSKFMKTLREHVHNDRKTKVTNEKQSKPKSSRAQFFCTKPYLIDGPEKLHRYRIPLIPTSNNKLFKALYHYMIEYSILNAKTLLIQYYNPKDFAKFENSRALQKSQIKLRPLNCSHAQFMNWINNLGSEGFKPIGVSYYNKQGAHSQFLNKRQNHFNVKDKETFASQDSHFYFALFQNEGMPYNHLAINSNGSIYNFSKRTAPNYVNTVGFVKALIKYSI